MRRLRDKEKFRILPYLDDFLFAPSPVLGKEDCARASETVARLFSALGLVRHPSKGEWRGSQKIEHSGELLDMEAMRVFMRDAKVARVQSWVKSSSV